MTSKAHGKLCDPAMSCNALHVGFSDVTSSTSPANPQGMPTLRRRTAEPSTSLRPTSLPRITVPGPTMAAPPPPPASPLNTLTPIVPRNPRIPRRGPSQHKGEPENHAQALEASPSRALTRPTKPTARLGHTIHPHPAPVAALAVAVGASQRQTVAVGPSRPTGPLGPTVCCVSTLHADLPAQEYDEPDEQGRQGRQVL